LKNLQIEDLEKYKSISELTFSPDGKYTAYVLHQPDLSSNSYLTNIWIYNRADHSHKKLTSCNKAKNLFWLDNETILFLGEKDKVHSIFYTLNIYGGEREKFLEIPLSVDRVVPVDEKTYVVQAPINNYAVEENCQVIDEIPFWENGKGFTNKKRTQLFIFNKEDNSLMTITQPLDNVKNFKVKNGKVFYVFNTFENMMTVSEKFFTYDITTKEYQSLISEDIYKIHNFDFMGQNLIVAASDMKKFDVNENPIFYIVENGEMKSLINPDINIGNSIGSDCRLGNNRNFKGTEDGIYFITTVNSASQLAYLDENGILEFLSPAHGSIDGFDIFNDKIIFVGMKNGHLQEIYELENKDEKLLSTFNQDILTTKNLSKPEPLNFTNNEGVKIEGFIIKPIDFDFTKKYPAILNIHGGPKAAYGDVYYHEMQYWANKGYFVFFCNPRGSEGRGNEFADIRGKYGSIDYQDIMNFMDKVLEKYPEIDSKKVAVTGGSYGGFMVNWIIGHTDRFCCAASQRSISNWISKLLTTDIGYYHNQQQQQADPWSNPDKLWYHSPLKYADKAKTPTLFIHSDEDYRCWMSEAIQMFTALKMHGIDSRICLFKGENHELSRSGKPQNRVRRIKEITEWVDKYSSM
jgi:dipeptidyl aminopeptidase/acylaminoacyl peptidase